MDIDTRLKIIEYAVQNIDRELIQRAVTMINTAVENGGTIYIFGNGGSAATASHLRNDIEKYGCMFADRPAKVDCLSDNIPLITAIANDISYNDIFSYQLFGKLKRKDVIIAISTSGNSCNVIKAVQYAKRYHVPIIAMTGGNGGQLKPYADLSLHTDINGADNIEDIHSVMCHSITHALHNSFKITE